MIETILSIVNTFLKLSDTQRSRQRETFETIYQPLFAELEPVVGNYMRFFHRAKLAMSDNNNILDDKLIRELREQRLEMLSARMKLREMAHEIANSGQASPIISFAASVKHLFECTDVYPGIDGHRKFDSGSHGFLETLELIEKGALSSGQSRELLEKSIENLHGAWGEVSRRYATLQAFTLGLIPDEKETTAEFRGSSGPAA